MGIGRFREETGTFQQSFGKEQSSLGLSWLIKGNHMVLPAPLVLEPHPVLPPFRSSPPTLTNPVFSTDLAHILQSCISQPASPPDPAPSLPLRPQTISAQPSPTFSTFPISPVRFMCNWEFRYLLQLFSNSVFCPSVYASPYINMVTSTHCHWNSHSSLLTRLLHPALPREE